MQAKLLSFHGWLWGSCLSHCHRWAMVGTRELVGCPWHQLLLHSQPLPGAVAIHGVHRGVTAVSSQHGGAWGTGPMEAQEGLNTTIPTPTCARILARERRQEPRHLLVLVCLLTSAPKLGREPKCRSRVMR